MVRQALYLPKEHGSWGMFYIPVILGLIAAGRLTVEAILFLVAGTALFLAREPFMTAWRCCRRRVPMGAPGRAFGVYAACAAFAGSPLVINHHRPWLLLIGMASAAVVVWHAERAMQGKRRSLAAELTAIAASVLGGPAAYYAVTDHFEAGFVLWALCMAYFASSVFYVKMRLTAAHATRHQVTATARRNCALYHVLLATALLGFVAAGVLSVLSALAFIPVVARALIRVLWPTSELDLRQVGWTEVVYSLVFVMLVGLAF